MAEEAFIVSFSHSFSFLLLSLAPHVPHSFLLSFSLSFVSHLGNARGAQGELTPAAGGLREVAEDGERERTV